jgi:CRP-like cAMP-binding protein
MDSAPKNLLGVMNPDFAEKTIEKKRPGTYLAQRDLFLGMDIEFVKKITELSEHISYKKGDIVFDIGEPADYFFVLLKGSVNMEREKDKWHTAQNPGEIFGWSSLIGREVYAAYAVCITDSDILKIEKEAFVELLDSSPEDKATLYEHLSIMLGSQLLEVYSTAG